MLETPENIVFKIVQIVYTRAEIHQPLLTHFFLPVEFFIGKVPVNNKDSRFLRLVNLTLDFYNNWDDISNHAMSLLVFLKYSN